MTTINTETVDKLCRLSGTVPDDQREKLVGDLSAIVSFIDKLSEANTENATPLLSTLELTQTLLTNEKILSQSKINVRLCKR